MFLYMNIIIFVTSGHALSTRHPLARILNQCIQNQNRNTTELYYYYIKSCHVLSVQSNSGLLVQQVSKCCAPPPFCAFNDIVTVECVGEEAECCKYCWVPWHHGPQMDEVWFHAETDEQHTLENISRKTRPQQTQRVSECRLSGLRRRLRLRWRFSFPSKQAVPRLQLKNVFPPESYTLCVCVRLGTVLARKTWLHHQNNLDQSFTHQRFAQASEMGQLEDDANAKNTSQNHIPEIDITYLSFDVHLLHRQLWLDQLRHSVSVTKAFAAFSWVMGECGPLATSQCNVETKGIIYLSWNRWLYLELENIA